MSNNRIGTPTRDMYKVRYLNYLNNPLVCTCDLYWIKEAVRFSLHQTICSDKPESTIFEYLDKFCCKFKKGVCTPDITTATVAPPASQLQGNLVIIVCTGVAFLACVAILSYLIIMKGCKVCRVRRVNQPEQG